MKTSMKKRIVSALLTLAMLASFLPAELFPKAEAVAGLKLEIVKLDPNTGAYEIKVTNGPSNQKSGSRVLALVPDVKVSSTGGTPTELIQAGNINRGTQTTTGMQSAINVTGNPTGSYVIEGGEITFDSKGEYTFSGSLPAGGFTAVRDLFSGGFYETGSSTLTSQGSITYIPYIAMLVTAGGTPDLVTTNTTYATMLPAQLTADPTSISLPESFGAGKTITFNLKNAVGTAATRENAVVDSIRFVGNIAEMAFDPQRPTIAPSDTKTITVTYDYPGYAITGDIIVTYHSAGAPNTRLTLTIPVTTEAFSGTPISVYVEQGRTETGQTTFSNPTEANIFAVSYDFFVEMGETPISEAEIVIDDSSAGLTAAVVDGIHSSFDEETSEFFGGLTVSAGEVIPAKEIISVSASEDTTPGVYTASLYLYYADDGGSMGYTVIPITINVLDGIPIPKVTFNPNGGNWSGSTTNIVKVVDETSHKLDSVPAAPTKAGATFRGWYDAATGGNRVTVTTDTVFDEFTTLYAQYDDKEYTVTVKADPTAAASVSASPSTVKEGGSSTVSFTQSSTQAGAYRFNHWSGTGLTTSSNESYTATDIAENMTFTAYFDKIYNVSYSTSGSPKPTGETGILDTDELTLPSPGTLTGSTFQGWYTAATGGTKLGNAGDKITLRGKSIVPSSAGGTATIYAHWTGNNYNVTANVDSAQTGWGTVKAGSSAAGNTSTASVAHGGSVTLVATPTPASDYRFVRWEKGGTSVATTATYNVTNVTEAATYTAVFEKIAPTYNGGTVTFTYNASGTQSTATASGPSGITYTMTSGTLPDGLSFNNGSITGTPKGTGAKPGDYKISVTATAANGEAKTVEWTVRVNKGTRPAPTVTNIIGATTTGGHEGGFTIGNYGTLNADPYNIGGLDFEYGTSSSGTFGALTAMDPNGSQAADRVTGLTAGSNKYIRVKENDYFNASPATRVEIPGPTTGFAAITVNRNDSAWNGSNGGTMPTITLQNAPNGATSSVSGNVVTFSGLTGGQTYKIFANGVDTGKSVSIAVGETSRATVNYYTVTVTGGASAAAYSVNSANSAGTQREMDFLENKTAYLFSTPNNAGGYGGSGTWSFVLDGATEANKTGANTTITVKKKTTATIAYTSTSITVDLFKNSATTRDTTSRSVQLYNGTTPVGTAITNSTGTVTFTTVPTPSNASTTFNIWVDGKDSGIDVSVTPGGSATATLRYYDVQLASSIANGTATIDGSASGSVEVLAGGTKNSVALTATASNPTNYGFGSWKQSPAGGSFGGANTANTTWTIGANPTVTGPITLTPSFNRNGYRATITVYVDKNGANGIPKQGMTVTLGGSTGNKTTDANGQVVFDGLTGGTTYTVTVTSPSGTPAVATGSTGSVTIGTGDNGDANATLQYYTVTAATGTGAATATVDNKTTALVLEGKTANLGSTPQSGYQGSASWTLNPAAAGSVSGVSLTVRGTLTATASYTPSEFTVSAPGAKLVYGTQYGTAAGGNGSVTVATISGTTGDTYTYGTVTGTLPAGMNLVQNPNGTITIWGKPQVVTSTPVTISFEATSGLNQTHKTVSFTVAVGKATPTITLTPQSGHYAGDATTSAVTPTVNGPYWNGTSWVTVTQTANSTLTYNPTTLADNGSGKTHVTMTVAATGGSVPLGNVWDKTTAECDVTLAASHNVTINVRKDYGSSAATFFRAGETVTLKTSGGAAVQNGSGTLSASGSVTLNNVPDNSAAYDVFIGSDSTRVATVRVSGSNQTVNVDYYTLELSSANTTMGTISGQSPANGTYLKGQSVSATPKPNTGYSFKNWTDESNAAASLPTTLTGRTVLKANFEANGLNKPGDKTLSYTYGDTVTNAAVATISGTGVSFNSSSFTYTGTVPGGLTLNFDSTTGAITVSGRPYEVGTQVINYTVTATNGASTTGKLTIEVGKYNPRVTVTTKPGTHYVGDSVDSAAKVTFSGPYYDGTRWDTLDQDTTGAGWDFDKTALTGNPTPVTATIKYANQNTPLGDVWDPLTGSGNITATQTVELTVAVRLNGSANGLRDGQLVQISDGTFTRSATVDATSHSVSILVPTGTYTITVGNDKKTGVYVGAAGTHNFDYYDVKYGACGAGGSYATTPSNTMVLLGAASDSTIKNTVNPLPTVNNDKNYRHTWQAAPNVGTFSGDTSWTLNVTTPPTAPDGITLTPEFSTTGKDLTVNLKLDGQAYTANTGVVVISNGSGESVSATPVNGVATFENATITNYTTITVGGKTTGVTLNASTASSADVNYYTVTTKANEGASALFVGTSANPASGSSLIAMSGDTVHLAATLEAGYSASAAKWSAAKPGTGNTAGSVTQPSGSGATATLKVTGTTEVSVTFDANGLNVTAPDKMVAIYNMGAADWIAGNVSNGEETVAVTGPGSLAGSVSNGSGNYSFAPGSGFPSYLTINGTTVQLASGARINDNVGTVTFSVTATDTTTGKKADVPMTLEIKKAQPKIETIVYKTETHYYGDAVVQPGRLVTGTKVVDRYSNEDITQLDVANWTAAPATFQKQDGSAASYDFTFKVTGTNAGNYTTDTKALSLESELREPSPQAGTTTWNGDNPGKKTIKYGDNTAINVEVEVKNIGNTDITGMTVTRQNGSTLTTGNPSLTNVNNISASSPLTKDGTVKFSFPVSNPGSLAANQSYTVTFDIEASAGADGSANTASTTYSYILTVEPAEIDHGAVNITVPKDGNSTSAASATKTGDNTSLYNAAIVKWTGSDGSDSSSGAITFQPGVSYTATVELTPVNGNYVFVTENMANGGYKTNGVNQGDKGSDGGTLVSVSQTAAKVTMVYTFPPIAAGNPTIKRSLDSTNPWDTAHVDEIRVRASASMRFYFVVTDTQLTNPSAATIKAAATGGAKVAGQVSEGNVVSNKTDSGFQVWDVGQVFNGTPGTTYYIYAVAQPADDASADLSGVGDSQIKLTKKLTIKLQTKTGVSLTSNSNVSVTGSYSSWNTDTDAAQTKTLTLDHSHLNEVLSITDAATFNATPGVPGSEMDDPAAWALKSVTPVNMATGTQIKYPANADGDTTIVVTYRQRIHGEPEIEVQNDDGSTEVKVGTTLTVKQGTAAIGDTAIADIETEPDLSFQWQYATDGSTWKDIAGQTATSFKVDTANDYTGAAFRVVVTYTGDNDGKDTPSSVTAVTEKLITYYTVTIAPNPPAGGTADGTYKGTTGTTLSVKAGDSITLNQTANAGYVFNNWTVDDREISSPYTPTADVLVNANFEQGTFGATATGGKVHYAESSFTTTPAITATSTAPGATFKYEKNPGETWPDWLAMDEAGKFSVTGPVNTDVEKDSTDEVTVHVVVTEEQTGQTKTVTVIIDVDQGTLDITNANYSGTGQSVNDPVDMDAFTATVTDKTGATPGGTWDANPKRFGQAGANDITFTFTPEMNSTGEISNYKPASTQISIQAESADIALAVKDPTQTYSSTNTRTIQVKWNYASIDDVVVSLKNDGNQTLSDLTITTVRTDAGITMSNETISSTSLNAGVEVTDAFTLTIADGLAVGTHTAEYTITGTEANSGKKAEATYILEIIVSPIIIQTVDIDTQTPAKGETIQKSLDDPNNTIVITDENGKTLVPGTDVEVTFKWQKKEGNSWVDVTEDTFQPNTEYRPYVEVKAPEGYTLKTPDDDYTVNNKTNGAGAEIDVAAPGTAENTGTFTEPATKTELSETPQLRFTDDDNEYRVDYSRRLQSSAPSSVVIKLTDLTSNAKDVKVEATGGLLKDKFDLSGVVIPNPLEVGNEVILGTLDLSGIDTTTPGTRTLLELKATGKSEDGQSDTKATYTLTIYVPQPSTGGGTVTIEMPVVTYWVSDNGFTNDLTAEKMSRRGAKPSFVPKITAIEGLKFLGWSESDPTKIKDGTLPTLVDPLTFSITDDKTFYAIYEAVPAGHAHYVIGFPDGTFGPDHPITRGQVATIIARACLEDFAEGSDYGNPGNYNDVEEHWANSAIAFCSLKGVFTGYEDGTFRPDRYISRQELAAVVARLAGVQPNEGLNFVDSGDVANWALNGVYTNVANGWVNGYEDNTFRPLNDITRAETVKIFNGYLHRGVDAEGLSDLTEYVHSGVASNTGSGNEENKEYMTWPDVSKSHWAYFEVIEAANDHDFHWKDATQAVPPEHWDAAFIDDVWRYYDNENDGGEDVGKETPVFTVTYVVNGHGVTYSNTTEQVKIYESPSVEGLPAVVVDEGYYLAGWSEKDPAIHELTEDDIVDPTAHYIEGDKTFYAVFKSFEEYVPETVIVTYVVSKNGETYDAITSEVVWNTMPEQGTIPVAVADAGFIFAGWSDTDPSSGNVTLVDPASTVVTEDRTFYAVFQPIQQPSEPVVYARTKYIGGFEDGTFRPDEAITRAAVAKIIAELLRYDASQTYDADFVDLENHWAKNVIAYCVQRGVMGGYEDGTFRPDGAITRQEFAVIISRLAGTQSNEGLTFTDVDAIAPWALDGVYTAYVHGWINGYEDGTFLPEKVMTRAETVKIFNAYLGRSANVEEINTTTGYTAWNDVPATHWAYYEIVEASNNWGDLPQQDQPAPEEGQVSGENTDETVPVEGDDATAGQPTEGEDPTQTPGEGAQQPGEGETSDQPENGGQDEIQPDNGEDAATPNEGEDPALPNDEENEDNAGEGEDAPTDGDDQ